MPAYRIKTLVQASFWSAAVIVGISSVVFEKLVHITQDLFQNLFEKHSILVCLATPVLFLASASLVRFFAPHAKGSGIPQALKAMMLSLGSHQTALRTGLISLKTALVKVLSASLALLAGASVGREGPTVQISTAIFAWIGSRTKKVFPHVDFHSYIVAGSAAGVAAAFNTPLAGISFALEEMAEGSFAQIKQTVMVSVIVAGIAAQTLVGNYTYFGHPIIPEPDFQIVIPAIVIGVLGGLFGGLFAKIVSHPKLPTHRFKWWQVALTCGAIVAVINWLTDGTSAGSGYRITRDFMDSPDATMSWHYPVTKLLTTIFSFVSGMAGGIFSPSLAIGAGLGVSAAKIAAFASLKTCALLGMVAFFTGTVGAPLTAVIIVMEMTDVHPVIIPLMISAFVAHGVSRLIMPKSLYHLLAHQNYKTK